MNNLTELIESHSRHYVYTTATLFNSPFCFRFIPEYMQDAARLK